MANDSHATPRALIRKMNAMGYYFVADVCATAENTCANEYCCTPDYFNSTRPPSFTNIICVDGLSCRWDYLGRCVWMNPPYSNITPWVCKAKEETIRAKKLIIVGLLKCDTSAKWWKNFVHNGASKIFFIPRIKHIGSKHTANFSQAIVIWDSEYDPNALPIYNYLELTKEERGL